MYKKLPDPLFELVKQMLEKDPKKRIRPSDALKHPYFGENKARKPSEEIVDEEGKVSESINNLYIDMTKITHSP